MSLSKNLYTTNKDKSDKYHGMKTIDILNEIPDDAATILVEDVNRRQRWKERHLITEEDKIQIGKNGPIFTIQKQGRVPRDKQLENELESKHRDRLKKEGKTNKQKVEMEFNMDEFVTSSENINGSSSEDQKLKEREAYLEGKRKAIDTNPLVKIVKDNPDSLEALKYITGLLSEEIAEMEFEKKLAEKKGLSYEGIFNKKMRLLRSLSEIWLKYKELRLQEKDNLIDLQSPAFKKLFAYIIETVSNVFISVFNDMKMNPNEIHVMLNMILTKIGEEISDENWELKAKKTMES